MWLDRGRPIRQILSRTRIYVRLFLGGLFRGWRSPGQGPQRTPARRAGRRGRQAAATSFPGGGSRKSAIWLKREECPRNALRLLLRPAGMRRRTKGRAREKAQDASKKT